MNYSRNMSMTLLEYTTGDLIIGYKIIDEYISKKPTNIEGKQLNETITCVDK